MTAQVVANLVKLGHIGVGTWLGVSHDGNHVIQMVVHETHVPNHLVLVNPQDALLYKVKCDHVCEVSGMQMHRFLAQADLTAQGLPIQNLTRRGRKRKMRT
jgi:hypothetical protein